MMLEGRPVGMRALELFKAVTVDEVGLLERVLEVLDDAQVPYCLIGGQAVNAYVEPLVSLDVDIAVPAAALESVRAILLSRFQLEEFPHSINISTRGSDLRVQIRKDPRYGEFTSRAERRRVLGMDLIVASLEDVLQGKVWAVADPERRPSKRQKDLADIARLLESYPDLEPLVPESIRGRLETA